MICQVCKKNVLSELTMRCPSCGTDLSVLHKLEEVQDKYVKNAKYRTLLEGNIANQAQHKDAETAKWKRRSFRILALFLMIPLLYKYCFHEKNTNAITVAMPAKNDSIVAYIANLETKINDLQQDTASLNATKTRRIYYTLTKGETLAELGIRFFNNKKAGFRIARDNRLSVDDYKELPVGKTLVINFR